MKKSRVKTIHAVLSIALFPLLLFAHPSFADKPGNAAILHEINAALDLEGGAIKGTDVITVREGLEIKRLRLLLRDGSKVDSVESNGAALTFTTNPLDRKQEVLIDLSGLSGTGQLKVTVGFSGKFQTVESARDKVKRGVAYVDDGVMGAEGALLPSSIYWYPQEEDAAAPFDMTITLPVGYSAISEGVRIPTRRDEKTNGKTIVNRWKSDEPLNGIDIVAAKFHVEQETYKGIKLYTYFLTRDDALSKRYIEKTKEYLDLYSGAFGPYPFKKFAVVESFLPTGYGMPSFTLLGKAVIRLPFIPDTSLGHEIAHSWWGNSVFPDEDSGNWTEALTTFTADYMLAKKKGEDDAREFRIAGLRGYKNFAGAGGISLADFSDATTPASRAVGYGKGMMVFNMLYTAIGADAFNAGLKEFYSSMAFRKATWKDIMKAFEKASGKDLYWFFDEWVTRAGGPSLTIDNVRVTGHNAPYAVSFSIKQPSPAYIMTVPIVFTAAAGGRVKKTVTISGADYTVFAELLSKPVSLEVDPDYENFRLLSFEETPATFGAVFGDKSAVVVVPSSGNARGKYLATAELLAKDFDLTLVADSDKEIENYVRAGSVLVLGGPEENRAFAIIQPFLKGYLNEKADSFVINGKTYPAAASAVGLAVKNLHNPAKGIGLFVAAGGPEETLEKAKRLRFYPEESFIVIKDDKKVEKGKAPVKNSLRKEF